MLRAKGGEGNEAVEIGLLHATRQPDLRHVILIGDAPANSPGEMRSKRRGSGYDGPGYDPTVSPDHWRGTPFAEETTYDIQTAKLKAMGVPVDTFYLQERAKDNFQAIARETGGEGKDLNVNAANCGKILTDHVTITILKQVRRLPSSPAYLPIYCRVSFKLREREGVCSVSLCTQYGFVSALMTARCTARVAAAAAGWRSGARAGAGGGLHQAVSLRGPLG